MANTNSPFGFSALGRIPGSPAYDGARIQRLVSSSNTHAIYKGDLVKQLTSGYLDVAAASGAAGTAYGIADQFEYVSTSQQRVVWSNYWPGSDASADVKIWVVVDPNAMFLVQSTGSAAVVFADIGQNIDISAATSGSTTTGLSGMAIDQGTLSTSSTSLPFRIVNLASSLYPSNDVGVVPNIDDTTPYNNVIVKFNNTAFTQTTPV